MRWLTIEITYSVNEWDILLSFHVFLKLWKREYIWRSVFSDYINIKIIALFWALTVSYVATYQPSESPSTHLSLVLHGASTPQCQYSTSPQLHNPYLSEPKFLGMIFLTTSSIPLIFWIFPYFSSQLLQLVWCRLSLLIFIAIVQFHYLL